MLWEGRLCEGGASPTTRRKAPAPAQLVHCSLHHCTLGQTPKEPLPAPSWSCRNSPWALEANFQVLMDVLSFPQLEGWEVSYHGEEELQSELIEQGVLYLCWQLAWLDTRVINSAELHARGEEREQHHGCDWQWLGMLTESRQSTLAKLVCIRSGLLFVEVEDTHRPTFTLVL